jgi:hypothetical protein
LKKINNRDAERILSHLQKARDIIEQAKSKSDDGEILMDSDIAENCIGNINEILIAINNTVY